LQQRVVVAVFREGGPLRLQSAIGLGEGALHACRIW
jgi:hypothetical protein